MRTMIYAGLLTVALVASGCEGKEGKSATPAKPAAAAGAAKAAPAAASAAATTGGSAADCDNYKKELCGAAGGDKSANCTAIKKVVGLMHPSACKAGLANIDHSKKKIAALGDPCSDLVKKLCGDLGAETETCKMVTEKTKAFPTERCEQMMGNYAQVLAGLKRMEDANKPLTAEKFASLTTAGAGEHGPQNAKVTIVEFSDFQCPYCTRAATATKKLKEKYGDKIRIIFRQFPLSFHKQAHLAAQASLAAKDQGKFWEMHDIMFENQRALQRAELDKYAKKIGLDMGKFKAALDSGKYKAQVDADMALGGKVAVQGTPTMFMNGKRVANAADANAIGTQIDKLLAQ